MEKVKKKEVNTMKRNSCENIEIRLLRMIELLLRGGNRKRGRRTIEWSLRGGNRKRGRRR
jgi:hypothetical protein